MKGSEIKDQGSGAGSAAGGGETVNCPLSTVNCPLSLPPAWDALLDRPFDRDPHRRTLAAAEAAAALETVYPPRADWFAALRLTPPERVRVVILGQDPYHEPDQAMGLAFSVRPGVKLPPSLRNIYKELESDLGLPAPKNGDLTFWAEQGVLLLNTVLTVAAGRANSHKNLGWQALTTEILSAVSRLPQPIAFVLWGAPAQKAYATAVGAAIGRQPEADASDEASGILRGSEAFRHQATDPPVAAHSVRHAVPRSDEPPVTSHQSPGNAATVHCPLSTVNCQLSPGDGGCGLPRQCAHWLAMTESGTDSTAGGGETVNCQLSTVNCQLSPVPCQAPRLILTAPHPSPLSAYRGFFGSRPFSQINAFLAAHGENEIEWTTKESP